MKPITFQTKVWEILQEYPQLEDTLVSLSPAFAKLKNPVLKRTIAKVTSLEQAASIAGIEPGELVAKLRFAAGQSPMEDTRSNGTTPGSFMTAQPEWYSQHKVSERFDAGDVLDSGNVPMSYILTKSRSMASGT
ncbi:MAG: DUF1858 domain-containing protein, partial [Bacteroidales bacterium]|nr:DUF1858 domain-containing protein [Bacteroidales bacterium]